MQLTDEEHDEIWEMVIDVFSEYELYNLIEKAAKRLKNPKPQIKFFTAKSLILTKSTIPQALDIINKLIESDEDNFEYLYEKGKIYFIQGKYEEAEKFFIEALKRGHQNKFKIYL